LGRPVGVFRTHERAPRVLIANSNLVGKWANREHFRELERQGLMMYGQMTAGSRIDIGTQGILQVTYETFAAAADKRLGGTLKGTLSVTAGCGGMGGAQPLAVTMNDGTCLIADVNPARIEFRRRPETTENRPGPYPPRRRVHGDWACEDPHTRSTPPRRHLVAIRSSSRAKLAPTSGPDGPSPSEPSSAC
jgi:hypothetical protein